MKEWYLIGRHTRPNMTGGYENQAFLDNKEDAFAESLETDIAVTVTLFAPDLSKSSKVRCIIQNNTADTLLKSLERTGLFMRGTVRAGMYVFFENRYWLITGYPGTNGIYEKAVMILCQYKLRWQNSGGDIVERWCNGTSASKYDVGENGNNVIRLSTNTFTLLLPDDEETMELDGKRVFIDKRKKNSQKVYKVTRSDDILYDYGDEHGGILSFIADKTTFNPATDNQDLGICGYIKPASALPCPPVPDEMTDLRAVISGEKELSISYASTYTVAFMDRNTGRDIQWKDVNFSWNIVSDFEHEIEQNVSGDRIELLIENEDCADEKIRLQVLIGKTVLTEMIISVKNIM